MKSFGGATMVFPFGYNYYYKDILSLHYDIKIEKLLRWVFNKPLYKKPEIGKTPAFLSGDSAVSLGTSASFKRTLDAIRNAKISASGAIDEFFSVFSSNLERFRIEKTEEEYDELVINNIDEFLPYRNEAVQVFIAIAQYAPSEENIVKLHRFLEGLIVIFFRNVCDEFILLLIIVNLP
jgi:hypothetical protein